ncbi:MAG: AgmX/PglI C-terminal domain-containing protein, partial [Myxococcota bacterium]
KQRQEVWLAVRPWAYVYLNDKLCGSAPLRIHLPKGQHTLRLESPNAQRKLQRVLNIEKPQKRPKMVVYYPPQRDSNPKKPPKLLPPSSIQQTVMRYQKGLSSCKIYAPDTRTLRVSWKIHPDGRVYQVTWQSPQDAPKRFKTCIQRSIERWQFPKAKAEAEVQNYELSL